MYKEKDITYQVFSIRLQDKVKEKLKAEHKASGKSWNLFIKELLKYESKNKNNK